MAIYAPPKPKRNLNIVALRAKGLTLKRIGRRYNITRERVRQILEVEDKKLSTGQDLTK